MEAWRGRTRTLGEIMRHGAELTGSLSVSEIKAATATWAEEKWAPPAGSSLCSLAEYLLKRSTTQHYIRLANE